jgi:cobalt-zinc-cadmium efflux system outer membrane protein
MRAQARSVVLLAAIGLTGSVDPAAQPPATQPPLRLEDLERLALENNPTVRQAQADVDAARGRARQAGALPNPVAGYFAEEVSPGSVIRGGEHGVFFEQSIPLGGKLGLSQSVFEREADQAQAGLELQRQRIRTEVRLLYYDALAAERRVKVAEELSRLVAEAVQISRQLYNVGAADRPDVLATEVEASRAQLRLNAAKNRQFTVWRQLSAVAGADLQPGPLAQSLEELLPEIDRVSALKALLERSPELQAARAGVERARAVVSRARKETFPDLFLRGGAAYNRELLEVTNGRPEAVGWEAAIEVGVSLPLFNRNAGGIAAASAGEIRAEAEVRRLQLELESRLASAFDSYLTALRAAEVYRAEILPRADEAYRLYLARYREMAAAYPQVLIAQRTLLEMNEEYLSRLEEAWRAALQIQGFLAADALAPPGTGEL